MAIKGSFSPKFWAKPCNSTECKFAFLFPLAISTLIFGLFSLATPSTFAESNPDIKGRLALESHDLGAPQFRIEPSSLRDGSVITLITPAKWSSIGSILVETLKTVHVEFAQQLGDLQPINTALRVMPEKLFYQTTGAPPWTNALYYRNQVFIPISEKLALDKNNLVRSARHEYVHSIINGLSAGRCPGWLDEGLAQAAEGTENSALRPALIRYLQSNKAIPLSMLQGGFTKLETSSVAAAYAQSLIATLAIKKTFGHRSIRAYLDYLRVGQSRHDAFKDAFGVSEFHFQSIMNERLGDWASELQ